MPNQSEAYTVSIVVPVYNTAGYLHDCLNSLSVQTLHNIEVIIVNDESTDHSQAIIDEYVRRFPHIFRSLMHPHGGLSDARNFGIKHAHASYVGFVDSDDYVAPDMFEQLYSEVMQKDADVCFCGYTKVFPATEHNNFTPDVIEIAGDYTDEFDRGITKRPDILIQAKPYAWNKIQRKRLFDDLQYPSGRAYEDSATTYILLAKAETISYVAKPLYYYRQRSDSIIQIVDERIFDVISSCRDFIAYYQLHGLFEDCEAQLQILTLTHIFNRFKYMKSGYSRILVARFINQSFALLDDSFPDWRRFYCENFPIRKMTKWIRVSKIRMILYYMLKPSLEVLRSRGRRKREKQ